MSIWRKPDGEEIVICDGCGLAEDGTRPDLSHLVKLDLTAEMLAAGFPNGPALEVKDLCPECSARLSPDQGVMPL